MFRWYRTAVKCYVYLSDVSTSTSNINAEMCQSMWEADFRKSRWFTRGWTLQELIAPASVEFFSRQHQRLGDKISLEPLIHKITGIQIDALRGHSLDQFSVEQRMAWAANRETTEEGDEAYCLSSHRAYISWACISWACALKGMHFVGMHFSFFATNFYRFLTW